MLVSTSAPLDPGMFMSRKTRSGGSCCTRARARRSVGGFIDLEALTLQHEPHRLTHRGVILDDEDLGSLHLLGRLLARQESIGEQLGLERAQIIGALADPTNRTGTPSSSRTASTMPPLAEPSSFVSTTPETSTASVNALACAMPFWPGLRIEDQQGLVDLRTGLLDDSLHLASTRP